MKDQLTQLVCHALWRCPHECAKGPKKLLGEKKQQLTLPAWIPFTTEGRSLQLCYWAWVESHCRKQSTAEDINKASVTCSFFSFCLYFIHIGKKNDPSVIHLHCKKKKKKMYFAKVAARFATEVALASQTGGIRKKLSKFVQNLRDWERNNGIWEVITEKVLSKNPI